jgi:HEAT repeat protein
MACRFAFVLALATLFAGCARSDEDFIGDLSDRDPFVRALAAIAIAEQAPDRTTRALPVLLETIDRSELRLARPAADAIKRAGPYVVPELLAAVSRDPFLTLERRAAILEALAAVGEPAIPLLIASMRDLDAESKRELGLVLARIGRPALDPMIAVLTQDSDPSMRSAAALVLGEMGPQARNAMGALAAALHHDQGGVALAATFALPRIDPAGELALPALAGARSRPELTVRTAAEAAIEQIRSTRAATSREGGGADPRNRRGPER